MLSEDSDNDDWKKNFRMSRKLLYEPLHDLITYISPNILSPNRTMISANKKLTIYLYFLKDTGSLLMTANVFGIDVSTASKIIHEVCSLVVTDLRPEKQRFPVQVRLLVMCKGELSVVIARLISKCM